jgi:hypothetical protein
MGDDSGVVGQPPPGQARRKLAGIQRDRRVVTSMLWPLTGCYLTGLVEPCGDLPRKCLFIYLRPGVGGADNLGLLLNK